MINIFSWLSKLGLPLAFCVAGIIGYFWGERSARLEYEAEIAVIHLAHAEQEHRRMEAVALAEQKAREQMEAAVLRNSQLERELLKKNQELKAERASMTRRIHEVAESARRDCAGLPVDWVRLYNETLGLSPAGGRTASTDASSTGSIESTQTAGHPHTGIQSDTLTTPEDILAHIRDYGLYCRELRAGYYSLIRWVEEETP